jgi:hypothetical protein
LVADQEAERNPGAVAAVVAGACLQPLAPKSLRPRGHAGLVKEPVVLAVQQKLLQLSRRAVAVGLPLPVAKNCRI